MPERRPTVSTWRRFAASDRGLVSVIFAVSAAGLIAATGLAVDFGIYLGAQTRLRAALQAAALGTARHSIEVLASNQQALDADTVEFATNSFAKQLPDAAAWSITNIQSTVDVDPVQGRVKMTVSADYAPTFAMLLTGGALPIVMQTAAEVVPRDLDIALAVDVSGAMSVSQMDDVKDALQTFVTVVSESSSVLRRRFALAPFAAGVNVNTYATQIGNLTSVAPGRTCAFERMDPDWQGSDADPATHRLRGTADVTSAAVANVVNCPAVEIKPLADDGATVVGALTGLNPSGMTAGHLGLAWAYYLLSVELSSFTPKWNAIWPSNTAAMNSKKVAVLITGGPFNSWGGQIDTNTQTPAELSAAGAADTCRNMKSSKIQIFTIVYASAQVQAAMATGTSNTMGVLTQCAFDAESNMTFRYVAADSYELANALAQVAVSLISTRLVEPAS
jgi:Flp pilus assembly protein TadG